MGKLSPPLPTSIVLHRKRRTVELGYASGEPLELQAEYLRVFSPSAEVRGHGRGQEVLQWGKQDVGIERLEPVGNYALQLIFDDGHDTGIYSWEYLYQLGSEYQRNWHDYLNQLEQAGKSRDPAVQVLKL
jgi:DUF971 family protein